MIRTMKITIKSLTALLSFLIIMSPSPSQAEESRPEGRFSLAGYIGTAQAAEMGRLHPIPQSADVPPVRFLLEPRIPEWGVRLGYVFSRRFRAELGIELGLGDIMEDVGIGFAGIPLGKNSMSRAALWTLSTRLLFQPVAGGTAPYVFAGGGIAVLDTEEMGSRTRPTVEFGAGLKFRLSGRWGIFLEVRDTISFFRFFEDFRILYAMIYTAETLGVQHRPGVRLGIDWIF